MRKITVFVLAGSLALCLGQDRSGNAAQAGPAPPPEVDQALRARASKFFQMHVDGKYRQAEQYVAEEAKDYYYNSQKPKYLSFEIKDISYSDNFTKAKVVIKCEREVMTQLGKMNLKASQESFWKLEEGLWCWYVGPSEVMTPFGMMKRPDPAAVQTAPVPLPMKPKVSSVEELWKQVTVDKREIRFPYRAGSSQVVVRNGLQGGIALKLEMPETPGLNVKLERDKIPAGQTGRILLDYEPQPKAPKTVTVNVRVEPTNETIPVRVVFDPEPSR